VCKTGYGLFGVGSRSFHCLRLVGRTHLGKSHVLSWVSCEPDAHFGRAY
jgi:hypothetical protein